MEAKPGMSKIARLYYKINTNNKLIVHVLLSHDENEMSRDDLNVHNNLM